MEGGILEVQFLSSPLPFSLVLCFTSTPGHQNLGSVQQTSWLSWHLWVLEHCRFPPRFYENQLFSCVGLFFPGLLVLTFSITLFSFPPLPVPIHLSTHSQWVLIHTHTHTSMLSLLLFLGSKKEAALVPRICFFPEIELNVLVMFSGL